MATIIPIFNENSFKNITYLIHDGQGGYYCVDPFDVDKVVQKITELEGKLLAIINTHEHWDHVAGNDELAKVYSAPIWASEHAQGSIQGVERGLQEGECLDLGNEHLKILYTPGHTHGHICLGHFLKNGDVSALITGDTLFPGGVGNCKNGGDPEVLFKSVWQRLANYPDHTLVYAGHDYGEANMAFSKHYGPEISAYEQMMPLYKSRSFSSLGQEKKANLFLQLNNEDLKEKLNMVEGSEKQVFLKLRTLRDRW